MSCTWGTVAGSVSLRNVNACGQSASLSKALTLVACIENDGTNLLREATLEAYPNPSNGSFVIRSNEAGDYYLINGLGQTVQAIKLNATNNFRFEVSSLSSGVYFLTGIVNGTTITERVVVTAN